MCFKGYWFLQRSVFLHHSEVVWKGALGLILPLPHVWVPDLYLQGFPEGFQGGRLKGAIRSLLWGWGKAKCRRLSHMLKGHFRRGSSGRAGVVSHLLLPSLPATSTRPPLHHLWLERCSVQFRMPLSVSLNLSSRRHFAGGLSNRDLQITMRVCKTLHVWLMPVVSH